MVLINYHILLFLETAKKEGDTCSSHDQCPSGLGCHDNRCTCMGEMIDNNKYCLKSYEVLLGQECGQGQSCLHRTGKCGEGQSCLHRTGKCGEGQSCLHRTGKCGEGQSCLHRTGKCIHNLLVLNVEM